MQFYLAKNQSAKCLKPYLELFAINETSHRIHITYDYAIINRLVPKATREALPVGEHINLGKELKYGQ